MAQDVNGKEVKVGDKVKILSCSTCEPFEVGKVYEVVGVEGCEGIGAHVGSKGTYMGSFEIELVEEGKTVEELQPVVESNLTPKLIESLEELQVGDYFRTKYGEVINVMSVDKSCYCPISTDASAYNLVDLLEMGAYKVRVEPLEMVVEVKPKPYELVFGEDYARLKLGDIVKFKSGNTHEIKAVDITDSHPYLIDLFDDSWWVASEHFKPENIISVNGVNIHEEVEVAVDPYAGWVEGAKVRYVGQETSLYGYGQEHLLGYCASAGNFGVIGLDGYVYYLGHIRDGEQKTFYPSGEAYKHFELIKE